MIKVSAAFITVICSIIAMSFTADAADSAQWRQDDPSIQIYDAGSVDDSKDAVVMLTADGSQWVTSDLLDPGTPIRLLMVNGGFAPGAQIIVRNDRTLVPIRVISEILGAQVNWDANQKIVTVIGANTRIALKINSSQASVNGQSVILDVPAIISADRTYVPLRFIAEAMKAQVGYTDNFNDSPHSLTAGYNIGIVYIEKTEVKPSYDNKSGLAAVKAASADTYNQVADYLKQTDRTFSDADPDYDSQNIAYVSTFGRYFIYRLAGFEGFNILFNSYTGKIFCQQPGLPFLDIGEGFINIGWLYQ